MVVLMRHDDALPQGRRVYAVIRGWGVSSDGSGGITRPETEGQLEALRRAYRRAGFGIETVSYCEGHGTGTAVGDATELEVLSRARREAKAKSSPAVVGSIKANIGHTKSAAGVAGLIKATMAVHTQVLPPATGCDLPHPQLTGPAPALRVPREIEPWPSDRPLRASVSAMGFGGINAHVVLESVVAERRTALSPRERALSRSTQDAELFLFSAETRQQLSQQIEKLLPFAARLSRAELTDLAAQLQRDLAPQIFRAAIVAAKPAELAEKLQKLKAWSETNANHSPAGSPLEISDGIFVGSGETPPRIAFLFPGQGSPTHLDGGVWRRRFESVRELYSRAELPADGDTVSTRVMQPAVVTASLAGLKVLNDLGIAADCAIGHSLGEITALHWAEAFDEETLLRIARVRGAAMAELGSPTGAMLAIAAPWHDVQEMLNGEPLAVVGYNSTKQTVVAGGAEAIKYLARRAAARGLQATQLPVSHAFHTPLVAAAMPVLADQLSRELFSDLKRKVFSTVTGTLLEQRDDLRELLCRQVTSPVRFIAALQTLGIRSGLPHDRRSWADCVDLFIEVGPGAVLSGLVRDDADTPVVSLDAGGNSLKGLLHAVGAAFALGAPVRASTLFADRITRHFDLDWKPKFFSNPCELAPVSEGAMTALARPAGALDETSFVSQAPLQPLELIRELVAKRAELPVSAVHDDNRMLSDLHLNSITVGQLVSEAAKRLGVSRVAGLTEFANASVAGIARALDELKRTGGSVKRNDRAQAPPGVDTWVRTFVIEWIETKRSAQRTAASSNRNGVTGNGHAKHIRSTLNGVSAAAEDGRAPSEWKIFAGANDPLGAPLRAAFAQTGGCGAVVCLAGASEDERISLLLSASRAVLAMKESPRFIVVQEGSGGGGFARTLHLENSAIATCVVNVPSVEARRMDDTLREIVAEALVVSGFSEVSFGEDGRRFEPRLKLAELSLPQMSAQNSLGHEDVLLVTGGGKGIAAECALAFARETGVKLAILGRSEPQADKELADNLARFAAAGVRSHYARADVSDAQAVRAAVAEVEKTLGKVTGILHGAGVNTPQLIGALDEAAFRRTVLPKISGAKNVLAAVDAEKLRLFATFGSIIARTGLPGEADYAA
ncbi:MAG TPA: SDR family NAD(P)-dependent oxidoreductase, partial [Micropepsaceae bacterium]|nr:SDR family NAD(P)-dependent oxidoreductase [Micropepsaceae bacterium]